MNLLNDPYDCLCCNQTFCKSCIINYIKANNKCPFSEFFTSQKDNKCINNINELMKQIKPSSSNFSKVIQSFKFNCQNKIRGCNDELNIEEILEHEKICKYSIKNIKRNYSNKKDNKENNGKNMKNKNINHKKKNNYNSVINKSRNNGTNIQNDNISKRESKNYEGDEDKNNLINNAFRYSFSLSNNINNNNNNTQIKQQDSIMSFCDLKKNLDDKKTNTDNSSGKKEKEKFDKVNLLLKYEKSIDEINQKLSVINKFLTHNLYIKMNDENYYKLNNNNNIEKNSEIEVSEFNISENDKTYKSNSMAITNNYYDGSFINTINNFSNNTINKSDYLDIMKNGIKKINKKKISPMNIKTNKAKETYNKLNKLQKYLKYKKNTNQNNITKNLNKTTKEIKINKMMEINNKDKSKVLNETMTDRVLRKNSINFTPKLGSKSQKKVIESKNINTNTEINNSIYTKNEYQSPLEEILASLKNLENKTNSIEKILQSNNCLIKQEYSIQNDNISEKTDLNNKNEDKLNEEKIMKLFGELIDKKEENIKKDIKEQIESLKKFLMEQCIDEMRKSVLETNIDIMTLYHDKLEEFENVINKYYKNTDNIESK